MFETVAIVGSQRSGYGVSGAHTDAPPEPREELKCDTAVFLWAAGHSAQASETHKAEKGTGKIYEDLQELFNFACDLRRGLRS